VVEPENVLVPVRVSVPRPVLTKAMSPCAPLFVPAITPAKVVETPVAGFTVNVLVLLAVGQHRPSYLDVPLVQTGERVATGQLIALMGSTGNSTGPHLHFEVRIAGVPVDPLTLLSRARSGR